MKLAISTHWNAYRHRSGEALIEDILRLGVEYVELGYDLSADLVAGVFDMVSSHAVTVTSLHNFCPVPLGAPLAHPELFVLTSASRRERESAAEHITRTVNFAAKLQAQAVVLHAGNVAMRALTPKLVALYNKGQAGSTRYEKTRMKLLERRERKAHRHLDWLQEGLEKLLPTLKSAGVRLAMENLPSWEGVPLESEALDICRRFNTPLIACWHDFGHAQIREHMGFISHRHWLEKLEPHIAGFHVHDLTGPSSDHLAPGRGKFDFAAFKKFVRSDTIAVLEPAPGTPESEVNEGIGVIRRAWQDPLRNGG
ncbi:MAG: sugar phosphate isomerase/epimerase family protein [Verrucomicrobiota bacterium]|nr:sugar phosphate isomerase/epimerase family protein [Verrucomicrobiota bacterium]